MNKQHQWSILFLFLCMLYAITLSAQKLDSTHHLTVIQNSIDTAQQHAKNELQQFLFQNNMLNLQGKPTATMVEKKIIVTTDYLFYLLLSLMLCLGLFRLLNDKYFVNILRVFFNSTLRQNQLVDQLLQVKLPSFFLNLFFSAVAGIYVFLIISNMTSAHSIDGKLLPYCMLCILIIYSMKYFTIKFFGWLTQVQAEADNYIFIVFLLNKILGIFLLPVVFLMAFANNSFREVTMLISFFIVGLIFLLRYVRTYDLLKYKLKLSRFHFMIYIVGVEILPIFLIYKQVLIILNNNQ